MRAALAVVLLASAACDQSRTVGSRWVSDRVVLAAQGAVIQVTAADSADLAGAALRLEPGSLVADTFITVEAAADLLPGEPHPAGPAVLWGPAALSLAHSASMSLPVKLGPGQSLADLVVIAADGQGHLGKLEHAQLAVDSGGALVTFSVPRLGTYQAAAVVRCGADHATCPSGEQCHPGGECGPPPPCTTDGCPCPCAAPLVCRDNACRPDTPDGGPK